MNSEGEFHCPTGQIYYEGDEVSKSVEVVCEMQMPVPRWVTKDTMQILKPCKPGTIYNLLAVISSCYNSPFWAAFKRKNIQSTQWVRLYLYHPNIKNCVFALGCLNDCDCPDGEHCEDESNQCAPVFCSMNRFGSTVQRLPMLAYLEPTITLNSTAILQCSSDNFIFKGTNTSSLTAKCVNSRDCQSGVDPVYVDSQTGGY